MGIRQYHNKWRCYIVDKKGNKHQLYFDTEEDAQAYYDLIYADKEPTANYKKRKSAKDQDMPVGVHDYPYSKVNTCGEKVVYTSIKGTVVLHGKVKTIMRSYGRVRSRETAIKICSRWRDEQLKNLRMEIKHGTG